MMEIMLILLWKFHMPLNLLKKLKLDTIPIKKFMITLELLWLMCITEKLILQFKYYNLLLLKHNKILENPLRLNLFKELKKLELLMLNLKLLTRLIIVLLMEMELPLKLLLIMFIILLNMKKKLLNSKMLNNNY